MRATDIESGLTANTLRELLAYDTETGEFWWRVGRLAGQRAGSLHHLGYRMIRIGGRSYLEHRIAWLYVKGEWPSAEVDHKNRTRSDNRWENLRAATHGQNQCNAVRVIREMPRGVYPRGNGRYRAQLRKHGKLFNLGDHATVEAASSAYRAAAQQHHGEFTEQ